MEQNEALEEQLGQTLDRVSGCFSFSYFSLFRFFSHFFHFFFPFMMMARGLIEIYNFLVKGVIRLEVCLDVILLIIVLSLFCSPGIEYEDNIL